MATFNLADGGIWKIAISEKLKTMTDRSNKVLKLTPEGARMNMKSLLNGQRKPEWHQASVEN